MRNQRFKLFIASLIFVISYSQIFANPAGEGTIDTKIMSSTSVGHDIEVHTYLPSEYSETGEPYRLYIFLHGAAGDNAERCRDIMKPILDRMITDKSIDPIIVVLPQVTWPGVNGENWLNFHEYTDSIRNGKYESVITIDLLDWLSAQYNVIQDRVKRAIGGFSMGAEGSVRIAVRNNAKFGLVAAHDGAIALKVWRIWLPFLLAEYPWTTDYYLFFPDGGFISTWFFAMAAAWSPNLENTSNYQVDFAVNSSGEFIPEIFEGKWLANYDPATLMQNPKVYKYPLEIYFDTRIPPEYTNKEATDLFHEELEALNVEHTYKVFEEPQGHFLGEDAVESGLLFLDEAMDNAVTRVKTPTLTAMPKGFCLYLNYPNPFNAETTISYQLPEETHISLQIYNSLGQYVKTVVDNDQSPGEDSVNWDGTSDRGLSVPAGIYLIRMEYEEYSQVRKMALVR
ncbi:T9SS type A sorting domain-containing protein [candidate division KSB1 bacterium]|nr:T9SS type A sorting domain-containing protein [candidate division KSB1 bacterium]